MIIIGVPKASEMDKYYMADGDMIWRLTQAGFIAKYMDEDTQYFPLTTKLKKYLTKNKLDR